MNMNMTYPIIQEKASYKPLNEAELNTMRALCSLIGIFFFNDQLQAIATTLPVFLQGINLTVSRIRGAYQWATTPGLTNSEWKLTAGILEKRVHEIEQHTQGSFYCSSRLQQECRMIIQTPILISDPIEVVCHSIQTWFVNRRNMKNSTIGAVLFLFLIRRLCLGSPIFFTKQIDWSRIIAPTLQVNHTQIPAVINNKITAIKNEIEMKNAEPCFSEGDYIEAEELKSTTTGISAPYFSKAYPNCEGIVTKYIEFKKEIR